MATDPALLEPGRVIRLRSRLWRVDHVDGDVFGATPLDGRDGDRRRFSRSLEMVEPGVMPLPRPDALGDEREQRLLLEAYRFSMVHGTAPILGLQRSRAIPTDYQLVPLLLSLGEERVRLLIADDVGTGKTIEAGLVMAELMARGAARRVLVVVPANLREQWREALEHFFHVEATVVAGHLLPALERRLLPGRTVWASHDVVIASVDYLKIRTEEVLLHPWDLVIIDEAHLCAKPHQQAGRSEPDMERWEFARRAASAARHLVMLTATPHNGYADSYTSIIGMLDQRLVTDAASGPAVRRAEAQRHVVQRRRRDIEAWYSERGRTSPFPQRDADEIIIDLRTHSETATLFRDLSAFTDTLYQEAQRRPMDGWIASHLQKRALSSPEALRISLRQRIRTLERKSATDADRRAVAEARAAVADTLDLNDRGDEYQVDRLDQAASSLDATREIAALRDLYEAAKKITAAKDPKLARLIKLIPERIAKHPQAPRVMVFTKFTDTLNYLEKYLTAATKPRGKAGAKLSTDLRVFTIDGEMTLAKRREVFSAFEHAAPAVLIATDCISEGLNLQHACAELVHYELPWNPNRLEQRNGRVDRFHQREPVVGIRTLVYDDPLDAGLLELIVTKSQEMKDEYGFVPPFLANPDILMHLSRVKSERRLPTLFDESEDAIDAAELLDTEQLERIRDDSFYGQEAVSLGLVEAALARSRDEVAGPGAISTFASQSLAEMGAPLVEVEPKVFTCAEIPTQMADVVGEPGQRFTFEPELGFADPEIDIVDLAHPLIRRLVDMARDRAQLPECRGRIAARNTSAVTEVCAVVHCLIRYVARGEPPVLLEEMASLVVPVWGDEASVSAAEALAGAPGQGQKHPDEITEDAGTLLARSDLESRLDAFAAERAASLADRHAELDQDWAHGLDDVEVMSRDLLAITLMYPEVAG